MNAVAVNIAYIAAAALFVFGLKMLGSPATARRGNALSASGMLIAIVVTLASKGVVELHWIAVAAAAGALVGALASRLVAMTAMPEMVALFNGSGGVASLLVGASALLAADGSSSGGPGMFTATTVFLSVMIGGVTFTGSLVAWGKLAETIPSGALTFAGQRFVNAALLIALLVCGAYCSCSRRRRIRPTSSPCWRSPGCLA